MSARLTNEDWNRIVSEYDAKRKACPECGERFHNVGAHRRGKHGVPAQGDRRSRAAILESERDLLAALEALSRRYHREAEHEQTSNWRIKSWEKCDRTVCTDARAAIANAHRQDAS